MYTLDSAMWASNYDAQYTDQKPARQSQYKA